MFTIKMLKPKFAGMARPPQSFAVQPKRLVAKTRAQVIAEMLDKEGVSYQTAVRQYDSLTKGKRNG